MQLFWVWPGSFGGAFTKNFSKDSRITIMLITAGATIICEIISFLIQMILFKLTANFFTVIKIFTIEALYNVILVIIIYPLIEKTGNLLTKTFKEKKIFTNYY